MSRIGKQVINIPEKVKVILTGQKILVDGPNSRRYGRAGFYHYLNLFKLDVPIIFDDIHRRKERLLIKKISKRIGKKYKVLSDGETGVIL